MKHIIRHSLFFLAILTIYCTCAHPPLWAETETTPSLFDLAPTTSEFQDYVDDPRAEPLFDDEGNYFGFIPLPFAPEKYVDPALQKAALSDSKYDMRDPNGDGNLSDSLLPPIRQQGECGSCWSFASYGVLESTEKTTGITSDFSEKHMIQNHGFDPGPCDGGNLLMTSAYLASGKGTVNEGNDPYQDNPNAPLCTNCLAERYIDNTIFLPVRASVNTNQYIKQAILDHGALYTSIYYEHYSYDENSATYYYDDSDNSFDDSNHAVSIVGWDDDKMVAGASRPGAFIVRNSWGTNWGENGYFYVSYDDESIAFSILGYFDDQDDTALPFNKIYQHNEVSWTHAAVKNDTAWGGNWFIPEQTGTMNAVSFAAVHSKLQYEIVIYDDMDTTTNAFSNEIHRQSGSLENQGWHTIPLTHSIDLAAGDGVAVTVKFSFSGKIYPVPIEAKVDGFTSNISVNPQESFVSFDGSTWIDSYPHYNVSIKALVNECVGENCEPIGPPCSAPSYIDLDISMEGSQVNISWQSDSNCASYNLYYADFPIMRNISAINMGSQTTYSKSFTPGASFFFAVEANAENGTAFSDVAFFEVPCTNGLLCSMNKAFPGGLDVASRDQAIVQSNWDLVSLSGDELDTAAEELFETNSDMIDNLLSITVSASTNPMDLLPMTSGVWAFEILSDKLYLSDLYFASKVSTLSNGIPALVTVDSSGNKGVTIFGQFPYGGTGFITFINTGNCTDNYFYTLSDKMASGRYQYECQSPGSYHDLAGNKLEKPVTFSPVTVNQTKYIKFDYLFTRPDFAMDIYVGIRFPNGDFMFLNENGNLTRDYRAFKVSATQTVRDTGLFKMSDFVGGSYQVFWLTGPTAQGNLSTLLDRGIYTFDNASFSLN